MLDINAFLVEKGGDPEIIKASQKKRGDSVELVDEIIAEYKEWVKLRFDLDEHNKKLNSVQKEIGKRFKAKEDAKDLIAEKEKLSNEKKEIIEKKLKPIRIYVVKSIKLVTSFMNQLLILKMKKTMNWLEPGLQKITKTRTNCCSYWCTSQIISS